MRRPKPMDHHRLTAGWCPLASAAVCLTSEEAEKAEMTANAPRTLTASLLEPLTQHNEETRQYPQLLRHKEQSRNKDFPFWTTFWTETGTTELVILSMNE